MTDNIVDELSWRGLINQSTDLDALRAPEAAAMLARDTGLLAFLGARRAAGPLGALRRAHQHIDVRAVEVTDDAAACEAIGVAVVLVEGDRRSLKITEPIDMLLAEAILAAERKQ